MMKAFLELFPNRSDSQVSFKGNTWQSVSKFHDLTDEQLESCISRRSQILRAVQFGSLTRFTVLLIAEKSFFHSPEKLSQLIERLALIGVTKTKVYKNSGNESWLIFVPWSQLVPTLEAENAIRERIERICPDSLDSLASLFCTGPVPIPLQNNFAWLDQHGQLLLRREDISLDQALRLFLADMEDCENEWISFFENESLGVISGSEDLAAESNERFIERFTDRPETNVEVVVIPVEIAACESMQQLSLFPLAFERGPPAW
jgi:hypothetical protein